MNDKHAPAKYENSGPVAKDSLAADSLRAHGSFSASNPTGISGSTGSGSTFAVVPEHGEKVRELHSSKPELRDDRYTGPPHDEAVHAKTGITGASGGGKQAQEAFLNEGDKRDVRPFDNDEASARGSRHTGGSDGQTRSGQHQQSESGGERGSDGGREAPLNTSTASGAFRHKGPQTGKVGDTAEDVDWSSIPTDVNTIPDVGSNDDPGRAAEDHFRQSATRQGDIAAPGARVPGSGGKVTDDDNSFRALQSEENA